MNLNFDKIFPRASKPAVTITTRRTMQLTVDGKLQPIVAGETITISHEEFSQLERDDYSSATSTGLKIQVADPTPQRSEPASAPAAWRSLPACFADFFNAEAQVAVAREHIGLIRSKRKDFFGTADIDFDGASGTILAGEFIAEPNQNPISTLRPINFDDPVNQKIARFLKNAEAAAEDYLARLIETTSLPQQRRFLECGKNRIDPAEELQRVIDELAAVGLALFTLRIEALGLADFQIRKLFHGSADYIRYGSHLPACVGDLCSAGYDANGVIQTFVEAPVASTASYLLLERERIAELKPLLAQARKELAATRKAAA